MPPGTARYWSWLFAAGSARDALLGMYALSAEWQAVIDPGIDMGVARLKVLWWREELERFAAGRAQHPITHYLAALPGAGRTDFSPLIRAINAAAAEIAGAPIESSGDWETHANDLLGGPLITAARLAGVRDGGNLERCVSALVAGEYLATAIRDYRRWARAGRVAFAVDELLAAGIDNEDLAATTPPPKLDSYLERLRERAAGHFSAAAAALKPEERAALRHLPVLATLGARHLRDHRSAPQLRWNDLFNAWFAARQAASAR